MAYGIECPVCGITVDNNEFAYSKGMCKECVEAQEQEDVRRTELAKMMNSDCEQMTLEV